MKKRIFALFLAVAMLTSVMVAPAYAEQGGSVTSLADACPCGCGKALEDVTWKPYTGTASTGHYYLAADLAQATEQTVISGESMVLDLRGNTITTSGRNRLFLVSGYLAVLDSVGGGRLSARTPSTTGDYGGVVRVVDNETTGSTFELFSGTVTPSSASEKARYGGLVSVGSGGTFRMHDGMLLGGNAVGNGGGIYVEESTAKAEILGGSIVGCYASASGGSIYNNYGTVTMENCSVLNGKASANGGNIYCKGGSVSADNCVIASGVASSSTGGGNGGNIANEGGTKITIQDSVIRDGFTSGYGGNLNLGYGTHKITNTQIYGGTSGKAGMNIAPTHKSANVTLDSCTVDGGVGQVLGTLTLKGTTTVSAKHGGLNLSAQAEKNTTATGLTEGAEVYVSAVGKSLTGSLTYIKPAYRAVLTANGTAITCTQAADGVTAGYCPHCNAQVAWKAYGTEGDATHTYLTADMADFAELSVTGELVIDLCGFDITAPGRAFHVAESASLAVMDSVGAGVVTGSGVNGENGGIFTNAGTLKLYGGKYTYAAAEGVSPTGGGVVYNSGALYIYGSHLVASAFTTPSDTTTWGGAICMAPGTTVTLTMEGGRVIGGSATKGGGAYFDYNNQVTITGATFADGTSVSGGGNICCASTASTQALAANNKGKLTMTAVSVIGGESTSQYAGNVHLDRWGGATITDCYLANGETAKYGGNLSFGACPGTFNVTNTILVGGSATDTGGNFYSGGSSVVAVLADCLLTNGQAKSGGNMYLNNGAVTVKAGEISHGTTTNSGGNIHANTPNGVTFIKNEAGEASRILKGTAGTYGGNLYIENTVAVTDAFINGGSATTMGPDVYVSNATTALSVGSSVTGDIYTDVGANLKVADEIGTKLDKITATALNAQLYVGEVGVVLHNETLYAGTTAIIDGNGNDTWYYNNAAAVAACDAGSYVKLFTDNALELTKDCFVDLNGHTVAVSGDYAFYGMDSSGDSYSEPAGSATGTAAQTYDVTEAPNGKRYVAVSAEDGTVTYHCLGMQITGVTIRPAADGMYYNAKWSCDDTLKELVSAYGIVTSVDDMPDENFASDETNLWTELDKTSFESGKAQKGAVIAGILQTLGELDENDNPITADKNNENGKKPVYAKAYITLGDKTYVSNDNIRLSLYQLMKALDKLIMEQPIQYRKYNQSARNFYEKWKDSGMGDWSLNKIPAPTEDDGVIDVLMVGHSFCYYYVEELYALAKAAGVNIRVCNLYRSSHKLVQYYENWQNGVSYYQFFEVSDDTGGARVSTSSMSLESALAKYEWDFISMQERTTETISEGAEAHFESTQTYWEGLLDYLLEQFPDAQIGWHQTWTNQAGKYAKSATNTAEKQTSGAEIMELYSSMICDYYNEPAGEILIQRIPTGMAWQNCRDAGYDNLCCRLGYDGNVSKVMHGGDGSHDGDIGGGQYLNACVWFEVITGISVLGNPYRPEYSTTSTLSDELFNDLHVEKTSKGYALTEDFVLQLQQYAHEAVAELGITITDGNYQ